MAAEEEGRLHLVMSSHRERPTLRLPDHVCGTDGAPLIEVFSVSIDTYGKDVMKIYGDITITDGEGVTFNLYSREMNNPETVTTGQPLSLTFPEYRAISPKGVVKVDVCLMEVMNRKAMIRDHREWDYSSIRDYDIPTTEIFRGEGFSAVLKYIAYHCALIGYPKVTILGGGVVGGDVQVYGRIVASRIRKHQCITESGATTTTTTEIVLFDEPKDKAVALEYGITYGVFGAMVVPAYSYVEINAWLRDGITDRVIADDSIALDSLSFGYEGKFCGSLEVGITWCHPYLQPLPTIRELKRGLDTSSGSEIVDSEVVDSQSEKSYAQLLSQQSPSTVMRRNRTLLRTLPRNPVKDDRVMTSVMEIFSVSVGDKISKLFGSISVFDIFDHGLIIYKRDQHSPQDLSESNEVGSTPTPIGVVGTRRVITGDIFSVHLDLKDEEGRQVSDGHFQWRNDVKYPFFGKRMCCVVTGKHGYAAVHYTVFEAGLPARVEASLFSSVPGEYKIYGVVWSEYGNNKCVTYYEQEFYRNRHFVSPQKDPLKLCFESPSSMDAKIPLSKAVVGVPKGSSLDLYVHLYVENDEGFDEQFRHNVICKFGDPVSLDFKEKWFTLHLDMKWNCW